MSDDHNIADLFPGMSPIGKCLCRRALICKGSGIYRGFHHIPEDFESLVHGTYCFWWSTFVLLRGVLYSAKHLANKLYFVPRERRLHAAAFIYDCHYCGKKTRQAPQEAEEGRHYPSCCYDCIPKLETIDD